MKKIYIIFNTFAAGSTSYSYWPRIKNLLISNDLNYCLSTTNDTDNVTSLANKFSNSFSTDLLLVIGGDGTLNQAINGIKKSKRPNLAFSYLPLGTGNDFARAFSIENKLETLISLLKQDIKPSYIDVTKIHNLTDNTVNYFINNIGIGLDAAVVYANNHSTFKHIFNKLKIGKLSYVFQLIKAYINQRSFTINFTNLDNQEKDTYSNVFLSTITNHPFFGGGIPIGPSANPFDGVIDIFIIKKMNLPSFIKLFVQMIFTGNHLKSEKVQHIKYSNFNIECNDSQYLQMDGEDFPKSSINLNLEVQKHPIILLKKADYK